MKETDSIENGIGVPDLKLASFLGLSYLVIFFVNIKGIKSSGKFSYFLALFPYIVLFTFLGKSLTLDGAFEGIKFFLTPNFSKLLEPQVSINSTT